jgi:hypothetical protein
MRGLRSQQVCLLVMIAVYSAPPGDGPNTIVKLSGFPLEAPTSTPKRKFWLRSEVRAYLHRKHPARIPHEFRTSRYSPHECYVLCSGPGHQCTELGENSAGFLKST